MFKRFKGKYMITVAALAISAMLMACSNTDTDKKAETIAVTETETVRETTASKAEESSSHKDKTQSSDEDSKGITDAPELAVREEIPVIEGLSGTARMDLKYAEQFDIYEYENDFNLIRVYGVGDFLVVPDGQSVPENLGEDIQVIQRAENNIYLAATSAMAFFDSLDVMDQIGFSGSKVSSWHIDNAVKAMEEGMIIFAGKYSEPDYELLASEGCNLAIESTMILHAPKAEEMLESVNIQVFVDTSSYESHPLGRTEWVKVYGILTGRIEDAEKIFDEQDQVMQEQLSYEHTGAKVAYFYISDDQLAVARKTEDYIPQMIMMGGGEYAFSDVANPHYNGTAMEMSLEEFYTVAKDVDYIIYNTVGDKNVTDMAAFLDKSELLKDFKAVQEGNVWVTGQYMYQASDKIGHFIKDIHEMLTSGDETEMMFLQKLK